MWSYLAGTSIARERNPLDADWKFRLSEKPDLLETGSDASNWQTVQLPHDWSIELPTDPKAFSAGGGGFFPTGIGWYRREFIAPEDWRDQRVGVEFDGVYENADVWINDVLLGKHPYGYTPFQYDLTPHLNFGEKNTLAVRVDNSEQPNSRWYSGSGIYRHVWLNVTEPVHIDDRKISIKTERASDKEALLAIEATVLNDTSEKKSIELVVEILDPGDHVVASATIHISVEPHNHSALVQNLAISQPHLWSLDSPKLYSARFRIVSGDRQIDALEIPFGIRTIEVSASQGFLLNGKPVLLCGANVHHDNGPLGAAAFDRAETRKVEILKAAGFNAVRTSHNPPSKAYLAACDRLGLLVVDEAFDGWAAKKNPNDYGTVFHDWWQRDLTAMIQRDRNHPSVVMWSIGNEVYERGKPEGLAIAKAMTKQIKELDSSRPITAGINGLGESGDWSQLDPLFDTLDVAGVNYELHRHEEDHRRSPSRVIMSAESYPQNAFACWNAAAKSSYVIGDFVWSGFDYLGESGIGRVFASDEEVLPHWEGSHFPWHGANCGEIDITGWRKPLSHYRNIVWDSGEKLYMAVVAPAPNKQDWQPSAWAQLPAIPSWTWPGNEGKELTVEVYSRYPIVRLYLNEKLIGEKPTSLENEFRAEFKVLYEQGTLKAVGVSNGSVKEEMLFTTAGKPTGIRLLPDRRTISADGQDLCFVAAEVIDDEGRLCPQSCALVEYQIGGNGSLAAIGSGDLSTLQTYSANPRSVFLGRAMVVIRSTEEQGPILLEASSPGLKSAKVELRSSNQ
ncbi:glycoside hydrolase family 2 TIM barrel-domain containing protein [Bythopirellula polymerisocia]|nr:glycoside hydrolase family 2 TIM barrel-domain containing protein [Bythopirellula polymerisocia]